MTLFADSSALVTLYARETGRDHIAQEATLIVSQLARVEVPAALWRKHRIGEIDAGVAQVLTDGFEADYFGTETEPPRFAAVAVSAQVLEDAARLCAIHGLRAYDAVQLSCALSARAADGECSTLAAYDAGLRRAAATEGFRLVPPHAH